MRQNEELQDFINARLKVANDMIKLLRDTSFWEGRKDAFEEIKEFLKDGNATNPTTGSETAPTSA